MISGQSSMFRLHVVIGLCLSFLGAVSCSYKWTAEDRFNAFRFAEAEQIIIDTSGKKVGDQESKDYVLWNIRLGSIAFYKGNYKKADDYFERATSVVDSSIGKGRGAVSVALWESAKYFKGEVYERTALYYYRGLANFLCNKFDAARASFHNGLLTDKQSVKEEFQEDNASLFYLLGRTFLANGDEQNARISLKKASNVRPENQYIEYSHIANDNIFLMIETGNGPRWWVGKYQHKYFWGRPGPAQAADIYINGKRVGKAEMLVSWYHQGNTEGSTGKDKLQKAKSCIWQAADALGLSCITAICAVSTKADIRSWAFIPDAVWLFSMKLEPGGYNITLRFPYYESLTKEYNGQKNQPVAIDYGASKQPSPISLGIENGELQGYQESHFHIEVPESGQTTVVIRNGLAKQATRR